MPMVNIIKFNNGTRFPKFVNFRDGENNMKRLLAILLLTTAFVLPIFTSCVPSGYESENPNRPAEDQVDVEGLPEGQDTGSEPAPEPDAPSGEEESGE